MFEKRKRQVFDTAKAAGMIDQGEEFRTAFICQTVASPVLLSPIVTMFISGQRLVITTAQHVYTLEVSKWSTKKPTGLISKHVLGSVPATKKALSLQIDDDEKLYAYLFQFGDMKEVADQITGGSATAQAAPPTA